MKDEMARLRDELVCLEVIESKHVGMDATRYLAAARVVRVIVERPLGALSMQDFERTDLPTLKATAENIFFEGRGRFADSDGSGNALLAQALTVRLLDRLTAGRVA
jgi:hypothetical protein